MDKVTVVKDGGFAMEWKGIGVISGSCRAGSGYPDWGSTPASLSLSNDWLRLLTAAMSPNDGLATGAISVSGRATSGSGLVANPMLSEWISAWTDSPGTASGGSYPWIWTRRGRPLPFGLFPLPVGPRGGPGRRHDNRLASGCNKTRFFHVESADFNGKYTKLHWELEITPNLITNQSTLINCDFATKIRRFSNPVNTNLATGIGNRISPSSSSFPGEFYATISKREYILTEMRLFTFY